MEPINDQASQLVWRLGSKSSNPFVIKRQTGRGQDQGGVIPRSPVADQSAFREIFTNEILPAVYPLFGGGTIDLSSATREHLPNDGDRREANPRRQSSPPTGIASESSPTAGSTVCRVQKIAVVIVYPLNGQNPQTGICRKPASRHRAAVRGTHLALSRIINPSVGRFTSAGVTQS